MTSTLVCASSVDLIELHCIDGVHVLCITDFGHGMAVDRRVVPEGQVAAVVAGIHDAGFCARLTRGRTRLRPFRGAVTAD